MRLYRSPIFTSAKIKAMFHHLTSCVDDLQEYFDETLSKKGRIVIESKNIFGRFTAEAISTTALGFQGNCIKDDNSQVFKIAQSIQDDLTSPLGAIRQIIVTDYPALAKLFNVTVFRKSTKVFFENYVCDEITRRESQGTNTENDVIQMLIQVKNGQLKDEHAQDTKTTKNSIDWDDKDLIMAQVFLFFAGGFETTASLMQMCSWELAMCQNIQKELIQEVDDVLHTLNGKTISYETLNKMKYLDMVVNETLRKWPPLPLLMRECNKDYKVVTSDGKEIQFRKNDNVLIHTRLIQHDPKYFENPSNFDPSRFSDENKSKIVPGSFLSFGNGPRFCIGTRLALLEIKLVFFTILSKYTIEVCEKTPREVNFSQSMAYKEDVFVELKPRI